MVIMRLELLADRITLPLERFAVPPVNPQQRANPPLNACDQRMVGIKIAA